MQSIFLLFFYLFLVFMKDLTLKALEFLAFGLNSSWDMNKNNLFHQHLNHIFFVISSIVYPQLQNM
jgi:hypothetical protein